VAVTSVLTMNDNEARNQADIESAQRPSVEPLLIDCDTCEVRGVACDDCVISVVLGAPPVAIDPVEARALDLLADGGLLPPLRLRARRSAAG
jgi:hypothetical protein